MAFMLEEYRAALLKLASSGYAIRPVVDYFHAPSEPTVYLRHDVDRMVGRSVAMAGIERECSVHATYYFRSSTAGQFPVDGVQRVHEMGHEVGYHYETMSREKGDAERAAERFRTDLEKLRTLAPVATAAAHGSPLSRFDNRLLWDHCQPADFDLKEAYLDIDFAKVLYLTDTGGVFGGDANLRDHPSGDILSIEGQHTVGALAENLDPKDYPLVVLSSHPERWASTLVGYVQASATDGLTNMAKRVLRLVRR